MPHAPDASPPDAPELRMLEELNQALLAMPPLPSFAPRAVPGEGPAGAAIAFVGEQPGDQEERQGRPFVGPAGQLLDQALAEAGIDRGEAYVTNAVKHFKYQQRGKLRMHAKPNAGEVRHYRWWLDRELALVGPKLVVAMGATALLALSGRALPVTGSRGPIRFGHRPGFATVHPSYLLRIPEAEAKRAAWRDFVADLAGIRDLAREPATRPAAATGDLFGA